MVSKNKKMSRIRYILLVCFLVVFVICRSLDARAETPKELENLYARGAVLMDGDSGRVLFGKNGEEVLPMASTTKIMTCILALELADESLICEVSEKAAAQPQVHLGMRSGEQYRLEDLLYSMMLESHNDSAVCVAENVGGSVEAFAQRMNQKALEIGCRHTHYVTPNGLDGEDAQGLHATTAEDLARIMRYCITQSEMRERFLEITQTADYQFQDCSGKRSFSCVNHNALLTMMDGALSGKTGYTAKAGYCYVGAVRRDNETLIVALLACGWPSHKGYKWSDTKRLASYGFEHYERKVIDLSQTILPEVEVIRGVKRTVQVCLSDEKETISEDGTLALLLASGEQLEAEVALPGSVPAPVKEGDIAGTLICRLGEDTMAELPLVFAGTVENITPLYCLNKVLEEYLL